MLRLRAIRGRGRRGCDGPFGRMPRLGLKIWRRSVWLWAAFDPRYENGMPAIAIEPMNPA
jgi:hypothetical protein